MNIDEAWRTEVREHFRVLRQLSLAILKGELIMAASTADILAEVRAESTVADSVLAIVKTLVNENDPAARQAIMDGLLANHAKLDEAVTAGTPSAPPAPTPAPEPTPTPSA